MKKKIPNKPKKHSVEWNRRSDFPHKDKKLGHKWKREREISK